MRFNCSENSAAVLFVIYSAFKSPSNQFPHTDGTENVVGISAQLSPPSLQPFVTHISNFLGKQRIFNRSRGLLHPLKIQWLLWNWIFLGESDKHSTVELMSTFTWLYVCRLELPLVEWDKSFISALARCEGKSNVCVTWPGLFRWMRLAFGSQQLKTEP